MREFAFVNGTGSTIPAGAALRPTGVNAAGFTTVAQANADSSMYVIFNAPVDVANGAYGVAFGWDSGVVPVAVDPADEPYTSADTFGTKSGDWRLRKGFKGFRLPTASVQGVANAVPDPAGTGGTALDTRNSDNTDQITATTRIVASLTDGAEFDAVGTVNTLKPRAASATQKGMVTTATQTIGGRKNVYEGTDSSNGSVWARGLPNETDAIYPAGDLYRPFRADYDAGLGAGYVCGFEVRCYPTAPAVCDDLDSTLPATVLWIGGGASVTGITFGAYETSFTGDTPYQPVVIAGALVDNTSSPYTSFAVHRNIGGGAFGLKVGADAVVSGLTFAGGLYISGSLSAAVGDVTGLGTGVATFLATPSSDNLRAALTDETGTGSLVFADAPTLTDPDVGTQAPGDNSTKAASTAYVDGAVSTAVAGTTVSASYNSGTKDLTVTVNGVSTVVNLT